MSSSNASLAVCLSSLTYIRKHLGHQGLHHFSPTVRLWVLGTFRDVVVVYAPSVSAYSLLGPLILEKHSLVHLPPGRVEAPHSSTEIYVLS